MDFTPFDYNKKSLLQKLTFITLLSICITPILPPPLALFSGIILALTFGNPYPISSLKFSKLALQIAVVGLGFGMNLQESLSTGLQGVYITLFSVAIILALGYLIGRWLKLSKATSYLISAGTAICGGSAIAAISPAIRANDVETSVSLSTVFLLNSVGLILFPYLGTTLHLSQHQFGMWAAIAIHDTSSVVGAGAAYGEEALHIATTVKLTRALWIVPVVIFSTFIFKNKEAKIAIPWFIPLFILAMTVNSAFAIPHQVSATIAFLSKRLLTVTLFLIGAGLTRHTLRRASVRPLILGIGLWIFVSAISLTVILIIG